MFRNGQRAEKSKYSEPKATKQVYVWSQKINNSTHLVHITTVKR